MQKFKYKILFTSFLFDPHFLYADNSKGGMPQLDPSSYVSQLFWLSISFFIIFIFINYYFFPKLKNVQIERNDVIQKYIEEAEKLNSKSNNLEIKINSELNHAKDDALKLINRTKEINKKNFDEKIKEFDLFLENKSLENLKNLEKEKNKIFNNIGEYSSIISNLMYEKILNENKDITPEEFKDIMKGK